MLKLYTLKAKNGDCLILAFGKTDNPKYILVDGGPGGTYTNFLKPFLEDLERGTEFELAISSHEDDDHSRGLIDLFMELERHAYNKTENLENEHVEPLIKIKELWQNHLTVVNNSDISLEEDEENLNSVTRSNKDYSKSKISQEQLRKSFLEILANDDEFKDSDMSMRLNEEGYSAVRAVEDGHILNDLATKHSLSIPINSSFQGNSITTEANNSVIKFDNLSLHIIGPSKKQLDRMVNVWEQWVKDNPNFRFDITRAVRKDDSIPNLTSIMFLAEADGKTILFTGDGLYEHILEGLGKRGLLDQNGSIDVDVLKLPHHGSRRNVNKNFFEKVRAHHYVISGNGRYKNPHQDTLTMIANAAKDQKRDVTIHITYDKDHRKEEQIPLFLEKCPMKKPFTYTLDILDYDDDEQKFFTIDLSP